MRWKWLGVFAALVGLIVPGFTGAADAAPALIARSSAALAPGVTFTSYVVSAPQNIVNVVEILPGASAAIEAVPASYWGRGTARVATMCAQVKALACTNGDFFTAAGALGGELVNGRWVKAPRASHQQLWVNAANQLSFGAMPHGARQSLGATGYAILLPGRPISIPEHDAFADRAGARSLVGWNAAGDRFFVTVERGRGSSGMSLAQAAALMQQLGATTAVNEDGGSSAQMVVNGGRQVAPGEATSRVANAWAVVRAAAPASPLGQGFTDGLRALP